MSRQSGNTITLVAYALHLFGAIAGITSIVGLVINYMNADQYDEMLASHHRWMIRSFWWALLWLVVGCVFWLIGMGWLIWVITWLWYVYRHVRGLVALVNGEPLPR